MTSSTQQLAPALDVNVPGAQERLDKLRAGASVTDLYEGEVSW
jgi:hypothetical protein